MNPTRISLAVLVLSVSVGRVSAEPILPAHTDYYTSETDASDSAGTNHGVLKNGAPIVTDPQRGRAPELERHQRLREPAVLQHP